MILIAIQIKNICTDSLREKFVMSFTFSANTGRVRRDVLLAQTGAV